MPLAAWIALTVVLWRKANPYSVSPFFTLIVVLAGLGLLATLGFDLDLDLEEATYFGLDLVLAVDFVLAGLESRGSVVPRKTEGGLSLVRSTTSPESSPRAHASI